MPEYIEIINISIVSFFLPVLQTHWFKNKKQLGIIIEKLAGAKTDNIYYKSQRKRWKTFIFLSSLINQHIEWVDIGIIFWEISG